MTLGPRTLCTCAILGSLEDDGMFLFFSNRLGCLGSLLASLVGSLVLIALLMLVFRR
jgi:hypothetical protein